jgi:endonuclease G
MKPLILVPLLFLSFYAQAEIRSVHCPLGCPSLNIEDNDVIFNHTYALSNDRKTKFADWVAYEVDVANFGSSPGRNWGNDPLIDDSDTLEEADYKGANSKLKVDKGHLAPLASFAGNRHWSELNYISNITPQKSALNQGAWANLEEAIRQSASYRKPLFVIAGTIYHERLEGLPGADEQHLLPSAYFKVVYDLKGNSTSFIFEQTLLRSANYCHSIVSNEELRKNIDFSLPEFSMSAEFTKMLGCG